MQWHVGTMARKQVQDTMMGRLESCFQCTFVRLYIYKSLIFSIFQIKKRNKFGTYRKISCFAFEIFVPLHCDSRETRQDADSEKANRWERKVLSPAELRLISGREKAYLSRAPKKGVWTRRQRRPQARTTNF